MQITVEEKLMYGVIRRFVWEEKLPMEQALAFFTENPAAILKKQGKKGCLAEGADADILVSDKDDITVP